MTRDELAQKLNGREYGTELEYSERKAAMEAGLVVIFGASDDLVEVQGALDEEVGAYGGTSLRLSRQQVTWVGEHSCDCDHCGFQALQAQMAEVRAIWGGTPAWKIETDVPHAEFTIMEDGEPFCQGVVIDLKDLPDVSELGSPKNHHEVVNELQKQVWALRHAIREEIQELDQEAKSIESVTGAMHRKIALQNVLDRFQP